MQSVVRLSLFYHKLLGFYVFRDSQTVLRRPVLQVFHKALESATHFIKPIKLLVTHSIKPIKLLVTYSIKPAVQSCVSHVPQ